MRSHGHPYPFRPKPWADIAAFFEETADRHPRYQHMVDIVESVRASTAVGLLAGCTAMHDLMVVPTPVPEPPLGMVLVRAPNSVWSPGPGDVVIEHTSVTGHRDRIERPAADAVPLFWRFMIEKDGIVPVDLPG
ncbi:hypothetical protein [Cellulomonas humilata]|uniref:Uncharacterized protein n=1 Tax=Cellulomonas humilata TaxID=144055 RepID=A0ABU0ECN1_9CELL|nr:hypothetical protein [Cellulomonas humilata]MDQ0372848.1 hypothetical protein [Cellulomonas humilata]